VAWTFFWLFQAVLIVYLLGMVVKTRMMGVGDVLAASRDTRNVNGVPARATLPVSRKPISPIYIGDPRHGASREMKDLPLAQ
jgi:hypothetical protein